MATSTLQSFNVFLTERLTAAAMDIYGFVEKAIAEYQTEVYQTQLENQRLQRLLDLVYKPEIRLHRADSGQTDLPASTEEVCAQELHIQKKSFSSGIKKEPLSLPLKEEVTEPWTMSADAPVLPSDSSDTGALGGQDKANHVPHEPVYVVTVSEHKECETLNASQDTEPLPSTGESPTQTKKKDMFLCDICSQPFPGILELKMHQAAHLKSQSSVSTARVFSCCICGKQTDTRHRLMNHLRTHDDDKPYSCPICGNKYKLKSHIKEHVRTHTGERPYSCYICGKTFNRSSTMSKHARLQHREYLPFKCMQCSQRFSLLIMFKQHMKICHNVIFSV